MTQPEPAKLPSSLLAQIEKLSPEQQEALRMHLNEKVWTARFRKLYGASGAKASEEMMESMGRKFSRVAQRFIDLFESGEMDSEMKKLLKEIWEIFLQGITDLPVKDADTAGEAELHLEQSYRDLQDNLIKLRQATAQSRATEKSIKSQMEKNEEQASIWQKRGGMAKSQGNDELFRKCELHRDQFQKTAQELAKDLSKQKVIADLMRERLSELEEQVQRSYIKKQTLISRERAEKAAMIVEGILTDTTMDKFESTVQKMEQQVLQKESAAAHNAEWRKRNEPDLPPPEIAAILSTVENLLSRLAVSVETLEKNVAKTERDN